MLTEAAAAHPMLVKVVMVSRHAVRSLTQRLEALQASATPLDAAHRAGVTPVAFEGCASEGGGCEVSRLARLVSARLPSECFAPDPAVTPTTTSRPKERP